MNSAIQTLIGAVLNLRTELLSRELWYPTTDWRKTERDKDLDQLRCLAERVDDAVDQLRIAATNASVEHEATALLIPTTSALFPTPR